MNEKSKLTAASKNSYESYIPSFSTQIISKHNYFNFLIRVLLHLQRTECLYDVLDYLDDCEKGG